MTKGFCYSPTYRPRHSNVPKANTEEMKRRKEKAIVRSFTVNIPEF